MLRHIFLTCLIKYTLSDTVCETSPELYRLQFNPPSLRTTVIGENSTVELRFVCHRPNNSEILKHNISSSLINETDCEYTLTFTVEVSDGNRIIEIVNNSRLQLHSEKVLLTERNFTISVTSLTIGHARLLWKVERFRECVQVCKNETIKCKNTIFTNVDQMLSGYYTVEAVSKPTAIHKVFVVVLLLLVSMNNINMGCHLCLDVIKEVLKRPVAPIIGLGCQFLLMPLASYGFGKLIFDDYDWRLGLFVLGCSPGGTISNFWTLMFDGDLDLSVTMTFVSTIASIGMMPLWIFTLGGTIFSDGVLEVPYLSLVLSLLGLSIPLCLGLLIQRYKPSWAETSRMISRPFTIICLITAVSLGIYSYLHLIYLVNWKVVVAGMSVAWSGYAFGAIFGWMAQLTKQQIIAVSIETALQNASVAFILLQMSLPQPDADLTVVPVIAQLVVTAAPLWMVLIGCFINKRCKHHGELTVNTADPDLLVKTNSTNKQNNKQSVSSM